ncbi:MAG: hypothetical protein ACOWWR_07720 [Eubacteriales bacterium]
MTLPTPLTRAQRDNLSIGVFLSGRTGGATLDQILQNALGYDPNGSYPQNSIEKFEYRFKMAQKIGRDRYRERIAGYFTFNAMPFGHTYIYKAIWYTWQNPNTGNCQIVPMINIDLRDMRQLRDKDLNTRKATARSIRAADDIQDERKAIQQQNYQALQIVQSRMVDDESLGEILSGWHGLPYADIQEIIPQLPGYLQQNTHFNFQQLAANISDLSKKLRNEQAKFAAQISNWVMLQTGLPNNAAQLALQDAIKRLSTP